MFTCALLIQTTATYIGTCEPLYLLCGKSTRNKQQIDTKISIFFKLKEARQKPREFKKKVRILHPCKLGSFELLKVCLKKLLR